AEGATMVAAVLHLHEDPRQAALEAIDEMRRHFPDRHDVADGNFFTRTDVERGTHFAPRLATHLVVITDQAVDLAHVGEHRSLRLRRAAGHDNARIGPLALQAADRLPRLRHRLIGDGAAVDDNRLLEARALGLPRDHLGFERVEAAAEGDDFDAHATEEN